MDDEALLAATAAGDADAFAAFYRRHVALVVGFGVRATGDREAAADLTGEVFAAALSASGRYRAQHDTAAPWLIGIAHNKLRESQRRGRVQDVVSAHYFAIVLRPVGNDYGDQVHLEAFNASGQRIATEGKPLPGTPTGR